MIWKLLLVAERTFRKLNAAEKLTQVYAGCRYEDGELAVSPATMAPIERAQAA